MPPPIIGNPYFHNTFLLMVQVPKLISSLLLLLLPSFLLAQADTPTFSVLSGQYDNPVQLQLSSSLGSNIYYTIDGSDPDNSDLSYQGAINIDSSMTVRAIAFNMNNEASDIQTAVYLIDVQHTFPIVYLAFDPFDFYDPETGIYTNYLEDFEAPADITFFETDGSIRFSQPAKVEIQGSASAEFAHKSISVKAKKYNEEKLFDYPLFEDLPFEKYGSFVLRNSGQDWNKLGFRDAYGASLVADLSDVGAIIDPPNMDLQAYRPSIAYFNGEYRGIYNIRERLDKRYFKTHFDLEKNDYDLIKNLDKVKSGDIEDWHSYMDFLLHHDMSLSINYDSLQKLMDVDAYIDYLTLNIFINNHDWPGNNIRRYKEKTAGAKWRWMVYDLDFTFSLFNEDGSWDSGEYQDNSLNRLHTGLDWVWPNPEWSTRPFRACIQNDTWRTHFINRMADQLNVLFAPDRLQNRLNEFIELYEPEIDAHRCKWFGCWDDWENSLSKVENFVSGRAPVVRQHFVQQYSEIFGTTTVTLTAQPMNGGQIEFSTLNLDSNQFPWTGTYFAGIDIPVTATPAPGYEFVGWSDPTLGEDAITSIKILNSNYTLIAHFQLIDNSSALTINCPPDVYLSTATLWGYANWLTATAETTCPNSIININQINGLPNGSDFPIGQSLVTYQANDACGNITNCSFTVNVSETNTGVACGDIDGYTKLGEYNNHGYYLSENSSTWVDAAAQSNGFLASISNQAENAFLQSVLDMPAFIGINDATTEGDWNWSDGSAITYTNFSDCTWCGLNTSENDFGTFLNWDGTWALNNQWNHRPHVVKAACTTAPECPTSIAGFTYLGRYNSHNYYLSEDPMTWQMGNTIAQDNGGYLVSINSQEENDFVQANINEMVFIGFTDVASEGQYQWANNEPVSFNLITSNTDEGDYAIVNFWDGTWIMHNESVQKRYLMEMDCAGTIQTFSRPSFSPKGMKLTSIYPNPANDHITLRLFANTDEAIQFSILTPQGQMMHFGKEYLSIGHHEKNFDIQDFPPGVYYLKATGANVDQTLRFVKLRM